MGSVWEALHLGLQSAVVIKFVRFDRAAVDGDDAAHEQLLRTRFEREARAAAQVRSANVVQILDYGVDRGMPYLVMEMLEGEDLAARLGKSGRLSLVDTASIVRQVARALERAHGAGLVHRDLKPQNIFLARDGADEVVKVLDFGVAKELRRERKDDDSTVDGVVIGTPSYMSPEQAMGRSDIDHRSDLWSLGVIAFRALTGQKPFEASLIFEAIVKICSAPLPSATSIAPDLGKDVDAFFLRALARPPEDRFQSARELTQALDFLAHGGTRSVPEGLPVVAYAHPDLASAPQASAQRGPVTSAPTLDAMMASETTGSSLGPRPNRRPLVLGGAVATLLALGAVGLGVLRGGPSPDPSASAAAASAIAAPSNVTPPREIAAPSFAPTVSAGAPPSGSTARPPASASAASRPLLPGPTTPAQRPTSGKRPRPNVGY